MLKGFSFLYAIVVWVEINYITGTDLLLSESSCLFAAYSQSSDVPQPQKDLGKVLQESKH